MPRKTPEQLKQQAQKLLELAKRLETEQAARIGKTILQKKTEIESMTPEQVKEFIMNLLNQNQRKEE